jgi:hypothetical protein
VRALARLVALLGALAVGWFLFSRAPRDVVLVYDVAVPGASALEVDLRRGDALVRHAEFQLHGGGEIRHHVRLPQGEYALAWRIDAPGGARTGERPIEVTEAGTIILPLGR